MEFPDVVRRRSELFLRRSEKVASFALAREYLVRRRKFSVREAIRAENSITHHRGSDTISGRGIGRVSRCCGGVLFFRAMQLHCDIF